MNREIKFKYYFQHNEVGRMMAHSVTLKTLEQHGIPFSWGDSWSCVARAQFTGLLDKNDKEIYEGDIVEVLTTVADYEDDVYIGDFPASGHFKVIWNGAAFFDLERISGALNGWGFYTPESTKEFAVIGNVFENPELLAEKSK